MERRDMERRHRIDQQARENVLADLTRKLNRNFAVMVTVFVFLIVAGVSAFLDQRSQNNARVLSEIKQCQRLQSQRADDNANAWYQQKADLLLAKIIVEPGILKVLNRQDRTERVDAAADYRLVAERIQYEPPTDCNRAVKDPEHYTRPSEIPFPPGYTPTR